MIGVIKEKAKSLRTNVKGVIPKFFKFLKYILVAMLFDPSSWAEPKIQRWDEPSPSRGLALAEQIPLPDRAA